MAWQLLYERKHRLIFQVGCTLEGIPRPLSLVEDQQYQANSRYKTIVLMIYEQICREGIHRVYLNT